MAAGPDARDAQVGRAELLERIDGLLRRAHSEQGVSLLELEEVYTTGCGEVLELEAKLIRLRRVAGLTQSSQAVDRTVTELRSELRHVRTAIEWMREQADGAGAD